MRKPPLYDILLSFRAFAARAEIVRQQLVSLESNLGATILHGVDAYYRPVDDRTVIICHFDARLMTGQVMRSSRSCAQAAGGDSLDIGELSRDEAQRLRSTILPTFPEVHIGLPSLSAAAVVLARTVDAKLRVDHRRNGTPPAIRFLRGETWQAGRLVRIADDGMTIVAAGPPRIGDRTQIEIVGPRGAARLDCETTQVTLPCWAKSLGSSGFTARFVDNDQVRELATARVLAWARTAAHKASPPAQRRDTRFPLQWPAYLESGRKEIPVTIRDVSHRGLFVETRQRAPGERVVLRVPFDKRASPLRLEGRLVRGVDKGMAGALGLPVGFGIELGGHGAAEMNRFIEFVSRVASRADRRIVIGATGKRLDSLVTQFSAVGYLTAGASDPRSVYKRATEGRRAPELVLFDSSLRSSHESATEALKRRLDKERMPFLDVDSTPADTRLLVDAALIG